MAESDELVFQATTLVRQAKTGETVRLLVEVRGTHCFDVMGEPRWAALLGDAWGEIPAFGFDREPPLGRWIVLVATVTGFAPGTFKEDPAMYAELVAERGFADEVELLVEEWATTEKVFGAGAPKLDE